MNFTIVAATRSEANAARKAMPGIRVVEVGMGLSKYDGEHFETAIVCGVGGGLRADLPSGTIVVANEVGRTDGTSIPIDAELRGMLENGAREIGGKMLVAPILFSETLVTGKERARWANEGYAAADMESGGINADRFAVVRVILDTPQREISPQWRNPARAMVNPMLWGELFWLACNAPTCARKAASVVTPMSSRAQSRDSTW